ncbi:MAG: hypothetical protein PWR16_378 [Methanoculleus sp.]|nr:hypothetical protein [Methanoculleus sp.]
MHPPSPHPPGVLPSLALFARVVGAPENAFLTSTERLTIVDEVIPKRSMNIQYIPIRTFSSEDFTIRTISRTRRVKRFPTGYRHAGGGAGRGTPLPA